MKHLGKCRCGNCEVSIESPVELSALVPRICDCDFCQVHPSAMVSDPQLVISICSQESGLQTNFNGSGQAAFYHCKHCDQLLAVGAIIAGELRGAANVYLLGDRDQFVQPVAIQPWLLSPREKVERWAKIWGGLVVRYA